MATYGPSTGNYSRKSILAAKKTASNNPKSERFVDSTSQGATYDPVTLAQRYSNDYQAEINRRNTIDSGDPTIAVLNDLRNQKISGTTGSTVNSFGVDTSSAGATGSAASSYYDKYLREQQDAINKKTQAAVDANNAYIPEINQASDQSLQNAYILREQNRVNAPQALSAMGYTGGATETSMMGINTGYENTRNQVEQNRAKSLAEIQQNEAQIRATGDATLSDAASTYYQNLIAAQKEADAAAQEQANWQSQYDLSEQQYSDAAAQQAWQNAYDEKLLALKNATTAKSSSGGAVTPIAPTKDKNISGNYNTVLTNVKRALGSSNAGGKVSWNAAINYIQNSLKSGMITDYEANQMINQLGLN